MPSLSASWALMARRLVNAAALLALASPLAAQTATAPALKAAFLYNFATFAEWPADAAPAGPLTICVLGDDVIAGALDGTAKGRAISGRTVVVLRVKADGLLACHVLYLTGVDAKRSQEIIDGLKNAPVLTVSDYPRFAQSGGIAGLFVEDGTAAAHQPHYRRAGTFFKTAPCCRGSYFSF